MAELQSKQSGQATITSGGDDFIEVTVDLYTLARAILLWTMRDGANRVDRGSVRGWKVDTTTLRFEKASATSAVVIEWQLFIFDTDVTVQDIGRTGDGTVTIDAVTLARSFIVAGGQQNAGSTWGDDDYGTVALTATTTVTYDSEGGGNRVSKDQVVDFTGCAVQNFSKGIAASVLTSTTQAIVSVTEADTLLLATCKQDPPAGFDDQLWRMVLTSDVLVTFDRSAANSTTITWELDVIEYTDGTTLQTGSHTLADADAQDDITIDAVTLAESGVLLGGTSNWQSHGTTASTDDDTQDSFTSAILSDNVTVQVERTETDGACGLYYQVLEWNVAAVAGAAIQLLVDGGLHQLLVDAGVIQKIVD